MTAGSGAGQAGVLVTGASGFIGRRVVERLVAEGQQPVVVEHRWPDLEALEGMVGDRAVELCIHLGWYTSPKDYLTADAQNLASLKSSLELVELLRRREARRLVVAGTSAEYATSDERLRESAPTGSWSVYGAAKSSLRLLLESSYRPERLEVAWARLFNVTGPGEAAERFLPWVTRTLLHGQPVDLTAGEQVLDYLDVDDMAGALVALAAAPATGVFNVSSGEPVVLRSLLVALARTIEDEEAIESLLRFGARPYGAHDAMMRVGVNDRLVAETGWTRRHDQQDMLRRVVDFWRLADKGDG